MVRIKYKNNSAQNRKQRPLSCKSITQIKQELNYRKQIARQLHITQYVEGIYDNPVTLKSRLRVTRGHWKRDHWV